MDAYAATDVDFDTRPRRRWPWLLSLLVLAFLAGLASAAYALAHDARVAGWLGLVPRETAEARVAMARAIVVRPPPPRLSAPATTGDTAEVEQRLSAINSRVDEIEAQAQAATGDASRAEGLLVAFAARRALDRGVELGYIEGLLRQRFGRGQPEAVATILSAARMPVTLAGLQTGFEMIAPTLAADGAAAQPSWWQAFRRELAGLVVVRHADEPSALPADRVARAQRMLDGGQVDGALAEVVRLPNHAAAAGWIASARRYLSGRAALDRIETAALLDPGPDPVPVATSAPAPAPTLSTVTPLD